MNFDHTIKDGVKYSGPYWDQSEIDAGIDCLKNGNWLSSGDKVRQFERSFSRKFQAGYSVMVNSGSSANLIMLAGLKKFFDWPDGGEVIVSPVGFPTTIAPIVQNNLKPVFVDIEFNTLNFDLDKIKITDKTVAIFLSPVLGNPPDMDRLLDIEAPLILDNCDSLGSKWDGEYLTKYATAFSSSFYPAHHITTGEGGMVSCYNKELGLLFRSFLNWGRDCHCVGIANMLKDGTCKTRFSGWLKDYDGIVDHKYVFSNMGYNLKPLDLQGAFGIEQLKKWGEIEVKRKINYHRMAALFMMYLDVRMVKVLDKSNPCWFGAPFITKQKNKIVRFLEDNNIQTRNYFAGNILLHPGYRHLGNWQDYPQANKVLDSVFFVGCHPAYTDETFNYIEKVLCKF